MIKKLGSRSYAPDIPVSVLSSAAVVGKKEGEGPLKGCFDFISDDSYFGESSWEKAESRMIKQTFDTACRKGGISPTALDAVFSGDLLNQCVSSAFAMKDSSVPYFGLYGACSTMTESLSLASLLIGSGGMHSACAVTGSHFCSAERQYRFPLEYGCQRPPSAQWTVTGSGSCVLKNAKKGPCIARATVGRIVDLGVKDANNMGAAMAPAAFETLRAHFDDLGLAPEDYDLIVTGDLGKLGHQIVSDLFSREGVQLGTRCRDCGMMIFNLEEQDVHCGGSGCGCSASVLCGHLLGKMRRRELNRLLFCGTGALLSPLTTQQGESVPAVCHAVSITTERS